MTRRTSKGKNQSIKMTELDRAVLEATSKPINIRTPEGSRTVTVLEAVVATIAKTALGGSTHAQRHLLERIEEADSSKQHEIERDVEIGHKLRNMMQAKRLACFKKGKDPEAVLPHPDDIIIDKATGYSIVGPIDEVELRECKRICNLRDALLLQDALEIRLMPAEQESYSPVTTPAVLAMILNHNVPERFRYSEIELIMKVENNSNRSKRELLRDCYQAWKRMNYSVRRGFVFPDVEVLQRKFGIVAGARDFIRKNDKAGAQVSVFDIANEIGWLSQQS